MKGMLMETDDCGTTIIVKDKNDSKARRSSQKLNAEANEFVSSIPYSSDDGDYFDQQEQNEIMYDLQHHEHPEEYLSPVYDDDDSFWVRRSSQDSLDTARAMLSRSSSPSPGPLSLDSPFFNAFQPQTSSYQQHRARQATPQQRTSVHLIPQALVASSFSSSSVQTPRAISPQFGGVSQTQQFSHAAAQQMSTPQLSLPPLQKVVRPAVTNDRRPTRNVNNRLQSRGAAPSIVLPSLRTHGPVMAGQPAY
jgi:hypothetical protein